MEFLQLLEINELLDVVGGLMRDAETQIECTNQLIERLRNGVDSEVGVRKILQCISLLASHSSILSNQMIELCRNVQNPADVIQVLSSIIRWPEDESNLIKLYKDLLQTDRQLLLPIISSLSSSPLSKKAKDKVFEVSKLRDSKYHFSSFYLATILIFQKLDHVNGIKNCRRKRFNDNNKRNFGCNYKRYYKEGMSGNEKFHQIH